MIVLFGQLFPHVITTRLNFPFPFTVILYQRYVSLLKKAIVSFFEFFAERGLPLISVGIYKIQQTMERKF